MSSKIVINNPAGDVSINGVTGSLPAPSSEGSTLISSGSSWVTSNSSLTWRNRIINGDMRVAQRGTTAFTINSFSQTYFIDRWAAYGAASAGVYTIGSSTSSPSGFSNSIVATCTTSIASVGTGDRYFFDQRIEGSSMYDFSWGTSSAKSVTVSFWVNSSLTGTYCLSLINISGTRSYVSEFSILSSNTWEKKTITIPGCTDGVWPTDNTTGVIVRFSLAIGSSYRTTPNTWASGLLNSTSNQVNWMSSNTSRTFYVTGVQLEAGSVATPYEMIPYDKQLQLCQRYYARLSQQSSGTNQLAFGVGSSTVTGTVSLNGQSFIYIKYPQQMRAAPTLTSPASTGCAILSVASLLAISSIGSAYYGSDSLGVFINTALSTQTRGNSVLLVTNNNATGYVELNAEL